MERMKQVLLAGLSSQQRCLSEDQTDTLCAYGAALLEKNQVMNLTAVTDPAAVARLHFLDSIALLDSAGLSGKTLVDVGCGAGLPGVPLKIAEPSIRLTLLDSQKKRMNWLEETLPLLGIEASCVCARAEEYAIAHREEFDAAVSRAVARLNVLSELCLPLVKPGGCFIAMKSVDCDEELRQAARAISALGGRVRRSYDYPVPGTDVIHRAVVIEKTRSTPGQYPRRFSKIKQQPL